MKISPAGAAIGAVIGCIARAMVVWLNLPISQDNLIWLLPSAVIGILVGAIAGSFAKPLLGIMVGAVLSGLVFESFLFACASPIGSFDKKGGGGSNFQYLDLWLGDGSCRCPCGRIR